jgi:hypothetical protein
VTNAFHSYLEVIKCAEQISIIGMEASVSDVCKVSITDLKEIFDVQT